MCQTLTLGLVCLRLQVCDGSEAVCKATIAQLLPAFEVRAVLTCSPECA